MRGQDEKVALLVKEGGKVMKERRVAQQLSMQDVMILTNGFVSSNYISAMENGKTGDGISFYRLGILALVYHMTMEDIFSAFGVNDLWGAIQREKRGESG